MDHLADSIAKLGQGRENWHIGREGVPVGYSPGEYEHECMDPSIGQGVNVSRLSCVSNKVLGCWDSYEVICDLLHHQESTVYMRRWSKGCQFRSFNLAVTLKVYLL